MDELKTLILAMKEDNKNNFQKIESQLASIRSDIASLKTEVTDLAQSVNYLDNEVTAIRDETLPTLRQELKREINNLRKARLTAELYSRKANLLFHNIPEQPGEDTEIILRSFLKDFLKYDGHHRVIFANVHRLPSKTPDSAKSSPIIAKFVQMKDRNDILGMATNLKGTKQRFGISQHLPPEMQEERAKLLPIQREARQAGKKTQIKIQGIQVKLYVNNELYKQ